jgi:hypothetical protein
VSVTVGPESGALKGRPEAEWSAKEVALTVLIDRWGFGGCGGVVVEGVSVMQAVVRVQALAFSLCLRLSSSLAL